MLKGKTKWVLGLLVIFSLVALVPFVMADDAVTPGNVNPGNGQGAGAAPVQLTEDQKQQLVPLWEQLRDTQKQIVQKKAEMGVLTQEQADAVKERIEARHQNKVENGDGMGFGAGKHGGRGPSMGMKRGDGAGAGAGCPDCPYAPPAEQPAAS